MHEGVAPPVVTATTLEADGVEGEAVRLGFRRDVQGLRGIAVLLVVLFHAEVVFEGGFIGVDVFFVISGFVIARLLTSELQRRGTIDLRHFYARRVRRILPVASIVTVFILLGSVLFLSPTGAQERAAETGIAASLFVANAFLAFTGEGYFAADDELNPFTHYWSLSVEEQFYLVMPALLMASYALGRVRDRRRRERDLLIGVLVISAMSLLMSWRFTGEVGSISDDAAQRIAFFASPTRVWEFCAGVLLSLLVVRLRGDLRAVGAVLGAAGLSAVLWAGLTLSAADAFPGTIALVPVLGTCALIVAGHVSDLVERSLSVRPLVFLGQISYSWYLWHWPAIVFTRALWPQREDLLLVAAAVTIPLSWLSYRVVEQRYRRRDDIVGRRAITVGAGCIAVPVAMGLGVLAGAERDWGLDIPDYIGTSDTLARSAGCDQEGGKYPGHSACTFRAGDSSGRILLVGDSHGSAISDSVVAASHALGLDTEIWTVPGCPVTISALPRPGCSSWRDDIAAVIEDRPPEAVVVAHRSGIYTRDEQHELEEIWSEDLTSSEALQRWSEEIDALFGWFEDLAIPLVYVENVPEYVGFEPPTIVRPFEPPVRPLREIQDRIGAAIMAERTVAAGYPEVRMIDLTQVFCAEGSCSPELNGTFTYGDWNHLSPSAVPYVAPEIEVALSELL